jgi:hypothetical protein
LASEIAVITDLGPGGNTPSETSLALITGNGRCNKNLRRKISVWTTKRSTNGSTLKERLRAFQPELSEYLICEKVLKQCPGNLEHAVKSRYKKDATDMNFEEMVIMSASVMPRANTF